MDTTIISIIIAALGVWLTIQQIQLARASKKKAEGSQEGAILEKLNQLVKENDRQDKELADLRAKNEKQDDRIMELKSKE